MKKIISYEPVLSTSLLDWFDENYIEDREECANIIIKAQRDYVFTAGKLKEGCIELKKTLIQHESLYTHIKLIGDLCNVGISAANAGALLRNVICILAESKKLN